MDGEIKLSAFTIVTNPYYWNFPIVESIKAMLPLVDELVIIDGGSEDGSQIHLPTLSPKIKYISDKDTKWEEDWIYNRMVRNYSRGFDECTGDWAIKFDADYVVDNNYDFRRECELANDDVYMLQFNRYNFQLIDRYFLKNIKSWAVNKTLCKNEDLDVRWGYDLKNWGLCDEAIVYEKIDKDGVFHGELLGLNHKKMISQLNVYNYAYCFKTEEQAREGMYKNIKAMQLQRGDNFNKTSQQVLDDYKRACMSMFKDSKQYLIPIEQHPKEIQQKINLLSSYQQGHSFWGGYERAKYYD